MEACIPQFFFRGLSTYSLSLQCLVTLCILSLQWSLLTGHEGAGMTRILLTHSIRNPLSFLLIFFLIFSVFISSIPSESVNDMFWSMIVFLGASQWHYNLRLTERAKMTLSRAQNIVMPKNINFVLFHCKGTFGPERYLRRRLEIRRTLRTFTRAPSFTREWMWTFRCPPRDSTAVCQYVDVNWSLTKWVQFTSAYLFQIAREKSCDYVLITYMKEYEIAYHNCGEAKRAHQVKK